MSWGSQLLLSETSRMQDGVTTPFPCSHSTWWRQRSDPRHRFKFYGQSRWTWPELTFWEECALPEWPEAWAWYICWERKKLVIILKGTGNRMRVQWAESASLSKSPDWRLDGATGPCLFRPFPEFPSRLLLESISTHHWHLDFQQQSLFSLAFIPHKMWLCFGSGFFPSVWSSWDPSASCLVTVVCS